MQTTHEVAESEYAKIAAEADGCIGPISPAGPQGLPGDVTLPAGPAIPNPANEVPAQTGIQKINALAADPDADLSEISRLIAVEIGLVIELMGSNSTTRSQTDLSNHVKALAQMQKTLADADAESKKDVLNMGGPKFMYVFEELLVLLGKALKGAGIEDNVSKQVMLQYRDLIITEEERIKREMNKL